MARKEHCKAHSKKYKSRKNTKEQKLNFQKQFQQRILGREKGWSSRGEKAGARERQTQRRDGETLDVKPYSVQQ